MDTLKLIYTQDEVFELVDKYEKENKKLKDELEQYKKQYEHSMAGENNYIIYDDTNTEKSNIHSGIYTSGLATLK